MKTLALLLLAAAMLSPNLALADEPAGADATELFTKLDANKDGQVTTDEVGEDQKRLFERLVRNADANKDGQLSSEEFAAGLKGTRPERDFASPEDAKAGGPEQILQQDPAQLFKRLDRNGDGKVTLEETPEEGRERFQNLMTRADRDGDGALTQDELVKTMDNIRRLYGVPGNDQASGGDVVFRAIDSNGDGALSAAEVAAAAEVLKKLDRNGDGQVTREELAPPRGAAGQPGQGAQAMLERLKQADANGDGKLSKDEAPERLQERFGAIDTNSDGFLDGEELKIMAARFAAGQPGAGQPGAGGGELLRRLKEADKNGDGKFSKDEAPDRLKERFDEIDTNKDGFIDRQEIRQRMQGALGQNRPGAGQPGKRPEGPDGKRKRPEGAPGEGGGLRQKFQNADKNGDGKLSKEEAPERLKERFDKLDANSDGQLDPKELQKAGGKGKRPDGAGLKKRKKNQA